MRIEFDEFPGHAGSIGCQLPDGTIAPDRTATAGSDRAAPAGTVGYRAACSCGWAAPGTHPPEREGIWAASSDWAGHMRPLWAAAPPQWLVNRSDSLRESIAALAGTWPLQALAVLAAMDRWHRPLTEQVVAAARETGTSWAEIGAVLGITRQSAHQRFRPTTPPDNTPG